MEFSLETGRHITINDVFNESDNEKSGTSSADLSIYEIVLLKSPE